MLMSGPRGGLTSSSALRYKLGLGYGIPALVVLLTVIVDASADKCAIFKPNFNR